MKIETIHYYLNVAQDIELSLPEFVYTSETSSDGSNSNHLNYYFLNVNGRQAIKRILCVYEYHYPHVTYNPGLLSICSLLLHYMQEHEVFSALCFMSSSKEHFIESKAAWDTACSVFIRLAKSYCVSIPSTRDTTLCSLFEFLEI